MNKKNFIIHAALLGRGSALLLAGLFLLSACGAEQVPAEATLPEAITTAPATEATAPVYSMDYYSVYDLGQGLYAVLSPGNEGDGLPINLLAVADMQGQLLTDYMYNSISSFQNGVAVASTGNKTFFIDSDFATLPGSPIWEDIFYAVGEDGLFILKSDITGAEIQVTSGGHILREDIPDTSQQFGAASVCAQYWIEDGDRFIRWPLVEGLDQTAHDAVKDFFFDYYELVRAYNDSNFHATQAHITYTCAQIGELLEVKLEEFGASFRGNGRWFHSVSLYVDLREGAVYQASDLFLPGYEEALLSFIQEIFGKGQYSFGSNKYEHFSEFTFYPNFLGDISLCNEGIYINYTQYGMWRNHYFLPFEKLSGWVDYDSPLYAAMCRITGEYSIDFDLGALNSLLTHGLYLEEDINQDEDLCSRAFIYLPQFKADADPRIEVANAYFQEYFIELKAELYSGRYTDFERYYHDVYYAGNRFISVPGWYISDGSGYLFCTWPQHITIDLETGQILELSDFFTVPQDQWIAAVAPYIYEQMAQWGFTDSEEEPRSAKEAQAYIEKYMASSPDFYLTETHLVLVRFARTVGCWDFEIPYEAIADICLIAGGLNP